ncbi:HIT-like domain-containing protein [Catenaria anguillulae PL171]|uniref:Bis(5'-adenosyl)-triphosphatase n=1 Tax=Catenaria anguillulae PL171 TaxID=765915 RepID=A0A1Y2HX78_9FUNG|nr:HIT-like domain-containing protein [Catenaria anguillulae PL171]
MSASASAAAQQVLFHFGKWPIPQGEVFFTSALSFAVVNFKPVLPGHVLVCPRRIVPRFADLTPAELSDLWSISQRVGNVVERHFKADSLTFAVQDGPSAGQTVPHVHVHVIPRRAGDFDKNDEIYDKIEQVEKDGLGRVPNKDKGKGKGMDADEDRKPRTLAEMEVEAKQLRAYFPAEEQAIKLD